jgi:hypothetical protein
MQRKRDNGRLRDKKEVVKAKEERLCEIERLKRDCKDKERETMGD